ncbi:hypothetical protein LEP1GSC043_2547 [Leptospira weilii str. Ecochallenge]|uniref:Uncharacterized protein n=1 Tax=Leptospira weilii str. Ecochallenge TaxID=1049986 RepID=N1U6M0_9LEPT|nr:hypothetical protein LEP1GSC043_2547 [Leptospira weilii str. Ecochallenge]
MFTKFKIETYGFEINSFREEKLILKKFFHKKGRNAFFSHFVGE